MLMSSKKAPAEAPELCASSFLSWTRCRATAAPWAPRDSWVITCRRDDWEINVPRVDWVINAPSVDWEINAPRVDWEINADLRASAPWGGPWASQQVPSPWSFLL